MTGFDKAIAIRCFEEDPPNEAARLVVDYWLSLWRGDHLPHRADFRPQAVARELRAIAIFEVTPGKSITCRLIGSALAQGLERDITGMDLLALANPADRPMRLQRWSEAARGAIGRAQRSGFRDTGEPQHSEETILPFGDVAGDGTRQILYHLSWGETSYDPTRGAIDAVNRLSLEFRLIDLHK